MWLIVADGWHIWDGKEVSLPSWPAQFELTTGNPDLNPNKITVGERCACQPCPTDNPFC